MRTGIYLVNEINNCVLKDGECALWWLGQNGFIVKIGSLIFYLDPYLSNRRERQAKPFLKPGQVTNADFVLGSHDHSDHIDRKAWPYIAEASPSAVFIVPEFCLPSLAENLHIPGRRFVGLNDNSSVEISTTRITGIAAAHEFLDQDPETGCYQFLGYIVETSGFTFYLAGDTCVYEGLVTRLRRWKFDLAFLPINGRDARRLSSKCVGNMTYQEAADLAGALAPGLTVPTHYGMFAFNTENPHLFIDYMRIKYPGLKTTLCEYGRRITVAAGTKSG